MSEFTDTGRSVESADAGEPLPESADARHSSPDVMGSPSGDGDSPDSSTDSEAGPEASARPHPDGEDPTGVHLLLADISATVRELAIASERYHSRAQQREGVIDHLHSEVDMLRRGERRALLRPLLAEVCRLRDDLLRQADELPDDFSPDRARLLLRSYAESAEIALENSGVIAFAPGDGDTFDPRMQRRVGGKPTSDPALHGCVATVRRSGYMDIESDSPIAPADVVLFMYSDGHQTTDAASVVSEGNVTQ